MYVAEINTDLKKNIHCTEWYLVYTCTFSASVCHIHACQKNTTNMKDKSLKLKYAGNMKHNTNFQFKKCYNFHSSYFFS